MHMHIHTSTYAQIYIYIYIYIYKRGTGWQAGKNYDSVPNWTSLSPTGHRPCGTPLVTAWPGLRQVGAKCGLSTVVSFKSEAVCHQLREPRCFGKTPQKPHFSVISAGTRPQLSGKGGRGGHGDYASWTQTAPFVRLITVDGPPFVPHRA